jgi:hypothetical protein
MRPDAHESRIAAAEVVRLRAMRPSLDPLRYGLRALDEMAREQASVAPPAPSRDVCFSPHPLLRAPARDGAALSLRLFTEAEDDATALVIGEAQALRFSPIPARAAPLFEAHAAAMAADVDAALTIGFPLVMFVQQGATRAAPLFSRGGSHARWKNGDAAFKVPAGTRAGATLTLPDALELVLGGDEPYSIHAGVWHFLFGLDGAALGSIAAAGRAGVGALVRAATRALEFGGEDAADDDDGAEPPAAGPLTREDLAALGDAAVRRAAPSRALRCHPHGLAMLAPRGDPTSGLRSDLQAVLGETLPPRGPLAVYLGAPAAPPRRAPIFTTGKVSPTPSQLAAASAFEGTDDIVAVCGPPGCGKTALLHHVAAQTIVACALGTRWSNAPSRAAPWQLVVTSTNNAAVDQALTPFVAGPGLPVGIRLGSRRALAESTAAALAFAMEELTTGSAGSLPEARAAFEAQAAPVRAFLREQAESQKAGTKDSERRRVLERRAATLREQLGRIAGASDAGRSEAPEPAVVLADLDAAAAALREHAEAAARLAPIHLDAKDGKAPSVDRAVEKWARANALRAPRIEPVLVALGLPMPFGGLDSAEPREDIARQRAAIEAMLASLADARSRLTAPELRSELDAVTMELGVVAKGPTAPPLEPALYDAALALRDAWAREHRDVLLPRLATARDAARAEWTEARGKPVPLALRELAALFPVAGCTLLSMRASFPLGADVIDRLVIDEAAQCAPIYAVPALARARRVMLTGDLAQLPPVYTLAPHTDDRLARGLDDVAVAPFRLGATSTASAQAVAEPRARARLALTEHFRSQHAIVALASRWSGYTLDVRTPSRSLEDVSPRLRLPVVVLPVVGIGARAPEGVVNEAEAAAVIALVAELVADGVAPSDIAVLTPFVGQSVRVERELVARGLLARGGVLVSTVHRLQGGERRVVIFSVAATERRHLRWLGERPHLLHVATSRAQDHLIVLVDPAAAAREPALAPLAELLSPR